MGKDFPKPFPRPKEIDFPECKNKYEVKLEKIACENKEDIEGTITQANNIFLLKSGNVLVSIDLITRENFSIKSSLKIFTVPDLNFVEEYEFPNDENNKLFFVSTALQLKNGNIFAIREKLYEFEGESIKRGPIKFSDSFRKMIYNEPIKFGRIITKDSHKYAGKNFMEIVKGKLLFTPLSWNFNIYCLNVSKLDPKATDVLDGKDWQFDIIFPSKIKPNNLYICKNFGKDQKKLSDLEAYDINDFFDENKKEKAPILELVIQKMYLAIANMIINIFF